jgi:hypothetical protein
MPPSAEFSACAAFGDTLPFGYVPAGGIHLSEAERAPQLRH